MTQVGLEIKFTGAADDIGDLDDTDKAYMILVGAVAAAEGVLDVDQFLLLASAAWDAATAVPPSGRVLQ